MLHTYVCGLGVPNRDAELVRLRAQIEKLSADQYVPLPVPGNHGDIMLRNPSTWRLAEHDITWELRCLAAPTELWELWEQKREMLCRSWRSSFEQARRSGLHLVPEDYEDLIVAEESELADTIALHHVGAGI